MFGYVGTTPAAAADAARQMAEASALRPGAMAVDIPRLPASLRVDQDDILIYALPAKADAPIGPTDRAVYHTVVYLTTVYRAATAEGAIEMLTEFDRMNRTDGWSTMPGPTGLPNARCVTKTTMNGEQFLCSVQVGRYVGTASGLDDRTDVLQQIAAQYVILTKADQNAT